MSSDLLFRLAQGALTGVLAAAAVDVQAFRAWRSMEEFAAYDWRLAAFRWGQGAVLGVLSALGLGGIGGLIAG